LGDTGENLIETPETLNPPICSFHNHLFFPIGSVISIFLTGNETPTGFYNPHTSFLNKKYLYLSRKSGIKDLGRRATFRETLAPTFPKTYSLFY